MPCFSGISFSESDRQSATPQINLKRASAASYTINISSEVALARYSFQNIVLGFCRALGYWGDFLSNTSYLLTCDLYSGTISFIFFTIAMSSWVYEILSSSSSFFFASS